LLCPITKKNHKFEPKIFQGREQLACYWCGALKDASIHDIDGPSQQESAIQPKCKVCGQPIEQRDTFGDKAWIHTIGGNIMSNGHIANPIKSTHQPQQDHICDGTYYKACRICAQREAEQIRNSQSQPAESYGFEEWFNTFYMPFFKSQNLSELEILRFRSVARCAWSNSKAASRQSLLDRIAEIEKVMRQLVIQKETHKERAEAAESKLQSLLAQKPEAKVSDELLAGWAERQAPDCCCSPQVLHALAIEVQKHRQLFKDAENGK
jgi:hypothetical protein